MGPPGPAPTSGGVSRQLVTVMTNRFFESIRRRSEYSRSVARHPLSDFSLRRCPTWHPYPNATLAEQPRHIRLHSRSNRHACRSWGCVVSSFAVNHVDAASQVDRQNAAKAKAQNKGSTLRAQCRCLAPFASRPGYSGARQSRKHTTLRRSEGCRPSHPGLVLPLLSCDLSQIQQSSSEHQRRLALRYGHADSW